MKKISLFIIICFSLFQALGQTFLNGSFEKNSFGQECSYNRDNSEITSKIDHVTAFGKYEAIDLLIANCIIQNIAEGNYALGIANEPSAPQNGEAISMELSENLIENSEYEVTFKVQAITKYGPQGNLLLGMSNQKGSFGTEVFKAFSVDGKWTSVTFKFTATKEIKFITVQPEPGKKSWNIIDDFHIKKM